MDWQKYLEEEMKYYKDHPEEDCELEAHTNGIPCIEVEYPE